MQFEICHFVETKFLLRKDRSTHFMSIIPMGYPPLSAQTHTHTHRNYTRTIIALYHAPHKRELKIDNAARSKTRCQYISTGRSILEFDCFDNHLKLVLVNLQIVLLAKTIYFFCYKLDLLLTW